MSGQDFLKKLASLMNVEYVEEFPIPEEANAASAEERPVPGSGLEILHG